LEIAGANLRCSRFETAADVAGRRFAKSKESAPRLVPDVRSPSAKALGFKTSYFFRISRAFGFGGRVAAKTPAPGPAKKQAAPGFGENHRRDIFTTRSFSPDPHPSFKTRRAKVFLFHNHHS
jgi:hypothetical protein